MRRRVWSAHSWRRWGDVADIFGGPANPDRDTDRELIEQELRQADADYAVGDTVSGEALRRRLGLGDWT